MSSNPLSMAWLKTNRLKSINARRFAKFCQQDFPNDKDPNDPDKVLYREAAQLILQRIEQSATGEQS